MKLERNDDAEPQTEAAPDAMRIENSACDERAIFRSGTGVVERESGPTGSPWSGGKRALVTAGKFSGSV